MDGGACWATVHGVAKSQTRLSHCTFTVDDGCLPVPSGSTRPNSLVSVRTLWGQHCPYSGPSHPRVPHCGFNQPWVKKYAKKWKLQNAPKSRAWLCRTAATLTKRQQRCWYYPWSRDDFKCMGEGLPRWSSGSESAFQCSGLRFEPWLGN